jgi:hypothetical protein
MMLTKDIPEQPVWSTNEWTEVSAMLRHRLKVDCRRMEEHEVEQLAVQNTQKSRHAYSNANEVLGGRLHCEWTPCTATMVGTRQLNPTVGISNQAGALRDEIGLRRPPEASQT